MAKRTQAGLEGTTPTQALPSCEKVADLYRAAAPPFYQLPKTVQQKDVKRMFVQRIVWIHRAFVKYCAI